MNIPAENWCDRLVEVAERWVATKEAEVGMRQQDTQVRLNFDVRNVAIKAVEDYLEKQLSYVSTYELGKKALQQFADLGTKSEDIAGDYLDRRGA